LLDEVGVQFPSDRALEIFADRAARVDRENKHPKTLDEAQQRELARILEAADRELG
jgi:trimethylamine:corrinoid methyltransferase-like protein